MKTITRKKVGFIAFGLASFILLSSFLFPLSSFAEGYQLNVSIPGLPAGEVTSLGQFIKAIYNWGLGVVGLVAFAMIVWGAIEYTVSAGNASRRQDAVDRITQAIVGLALLLGAYIILFTIDPGLVTLREPGGLQLETVKAPALTLPTENIASPQTIAGIESIKTKAAEATGKILSARNRADITLEEINDSITLAVTVGTVIYGSDFYNELTALEQPARHIALTVLPPLIAQAEAKRDEVIKFADAALNQQFIAIDALNTGKPIPQDTFYNMDVLRNTAEAHFMQLLSLQNQIEDLAQDVENTKIQIDVKIAGYQ
ncbi:MAG: hypothetical protein A2745_01085 [Candidatus Harrisonbacteria bacterium RIFCSPHIGHO2_01_FULL_44_13]|uniref:Uncharacterized protein n=1 Tax=Candidatus Harrisonbacteria bacterium RIFCSPLOWO2_01_FULL_44_18 TaxID=1798407 RepID=A0A1G1ZMC5_9BACT|nr:MAG: hypothetical protein A2745_01085 [Candidatus Harrisonbacteria bacterium RIFCSPHIGHO2_01_FULL_44_13]OGY65724.1 MAG: hypothetical protein A3A16_03880 [Candidatus Harrisonbacteria bacterium RIFCSPLOWO2_01_FULL_44_18]